MEEQSNYGRKREGRIWEVKEEGTKRGGEDQVLEEIEVQKVRKNEKKYVAVVGCRTGELKCPKH